MDGYVILVRFDLRPGTRARFEALVRENAAASVRDEPGCRRFDVLSPCDGADRVVLYEIYDDRAAFEAHMESPHFAAFRERSANLIESRVLEDYDLAEHAADG